MSLITLCHSLCDPLGNWNFSCSAVFLGCSAAFFLPHFQVLHPRGCGPVFPILAKGAWKAPKTRANFHFSTDTHTHMYAHTRTIGRAFSHPFSGGDLNLWRSAWLPPAFCFVFLLFTHHFPSICVSITWTIFLVAHKHTHTHTETLGKGESETALTATERCDWNGISDCFGLYGFRPRSRTPWWNNNWVLNLRQECSICHSKKRRHLLHEQRDCERERERESALLRRERESLYSLILYDAG